MKRPICLVCAVWMLAILFCRAAGVPIFGEPALTEQERILMADGCIVSVTGMVRERAVSEETVRYTLRDACVVCRDRRILFSGLLISMDRKEEPYRLGSVISARGEIRPVGKAGNPGQFDPASYYACRRIFYRMRTEHAVLVRQGGGFRDRLAAWREEAERFFAGHMHEGPAGILTAMLLGDKAFLTEESRLNFQIGGCLHLLVISGLHIMLLGSAVLRALLRLRMPQKTACTAAGVLMIFYTVFAGASAAAVRACIMFLLYLLARVLKRSYDSLCALSASAILILAVRPGYLFYAGFQLSFTAAFGASVAAPMLKRKIPDPFGNDPQGISAGSGKVLPAGRTEKLRKGLRRLLKTQWDTSVSWLAIQLCTLPLLAGYFYEIPVWSLPLNLLLVPWVQGILVLGAAGSAAGLLSPLLGKAILLPADIGLLAFDGVLTAARHLPYSTWICGQPVIWQCAAYYACLAAGLALWEPPRIRPGKKAACARIRPARRFIIGISAAVLVLFFRVTPDFMLTMMDVGQGDCFMIRRDRTVFLSDGGSTTVKEVGKNRILPYLKSQRISRLEGVFVSHDDADHISGIEEILVMIAERKTSLRIRYLFMPYWMAETEDGVRIMRECAAAGTQVRYLVKGDRIQAGDLTIEVLHPFPEKNTARSGNAGSLVLQLEYKGFTALLTGDLEGEGEKELIPYLKDIDCLKAAHHGSRNSTSAEFLEKTRPELALISAPEKSMYGHPHQETLDRLEEAGAVILASKDCGAVFLTEKNGKIRAGSFLP